MGAICCRSAEVAAEISKSRRDKEIEAQNAADAERDSHVVKLLLLGAGESGKSTLLKQFRVLYGSGFSEDERRALLPVVHANTLQSIKAMLTFIAEQQQQASSSRKVSTEPPTGDNIAHTASTGEDGGSSAGPPASGSAIELASPGMQQQAARRRPSSASSTSGFNWQWQSDAHKAAAERIMRGPGVMDCAPAGGAGAGDNVVDAATANDIDLLWRTPTLQRAYQERSRYQLLDSAAYFLSKVQETSQPGYVPSVEDVIRTRVRTSRILEEKYVIEGMNYSIFDVGGQRNERRKWIHCFADVTAIIFVASLSEYDQTLYEENTANRLVEAIDLFAKVCSSRHFENTPIVLFLNKKDLFEAKIKTVDLRCPNPDPFAAEKEPILFSDYDGGCDYDKALRYILNKFLSQNANPRKEIFYRVCSATDVENVRTVFAASREIILRQNLQSSGLLDA